jgi:hypothetical protein
MNYLSTRGDATPRKFCDILLEGLAPDGGLYLPEHYPQVDDATLTRCAAYREQGYAELAFEILSLYIDDIPDADLRALCAKTYTAEVFGTPRSCRCAAAKRACGSKPCPTAPRWPSRTWPCSCWATCSNTNWAAAGRAQHPGRHQRRHRQRGRIRHARQKGRARVHDSARTAA